MRKNIFKTWHIADLLLPFMMFLLLTTLAYAFFFVQPYAGFYFNPSDGEVIQLYTPSSGDLQLGDKLVQIGNISLEYYTQHRSQLLFPDTQPGDIVKLEILRKVGTTSQTIHLDWKFPGFNQDEFFERLFNLWWLSYIFLLFGAIIQLVMRPKDRRWGLMVAANYLTALWIMVGGLSTSHTWNGSVLLHAITWLVLPVYLAFHWIFPKPLGRLPSWTSVLLALASALLVLGEFLKVLHRNAYIVGFFLTLVLSAVFLLFHFLRQPEQRRQVQQLLIAFLLALAPAISMLMITVAFGSIPKIGPLAFVALPIMPIAYFYIIYRHQLGGLEVRANWLLSIYGFLILVVTLLILLAPLLTITGISTQTTVFYILSASLLTAIFTVFIFPLFQTWIERRVFGIKLPHENLQEIYAARIVTSTTLPSLVSLLQNEVNPSLLVRQFVFLRLDGDTPQILLMVGITADTIPGGDALKGLLSRLGKFQPPVNAAPENWVRLALPLKVGDRLIGLWLLGRRDPDDNYAQPEIMILQALADQTAVALSNIQHAESLREMYQADINNYEQERLRLARELHDHVLNDMAQLSTAPGSAPLPSDFLQGYQRLTQTVRNISSDLRPPMLAYGLQFALKGLAENLMERTQDTVRIHVNLLAEDEYRYAEHVEQHVFRIIQQGCENALRHGQASNIHISGSLIVSEINLVLEDDGVGFDTATRLQLGPLLTKKHFGLVGMYERAALINADLKIESAIAEGTRIYLLVPAQGNLTM